MILDAIFAGKPAELPAASRNDVVRMTYVRDVAAGISLVHLASNNQHVVYGLDLARPTTWGEVEGLLTELVPGCSIQFGRTRAAPSPSLSEKELNITAEFGFKPKYDIREGLLQTVEWYRHGQR